MALGDTWTRLRLPAKRLLLAYIFDWIVIIAIAAAGAAINWITPYKRPFSITDLSISYPYQSDELIKTSILVVIGLIAPGAIIFLVCLLLVPGLTALRTTPKSQLLRRKFWEWNVGWMGLGLSLATAFMLTQGMKLLFGKPRPDLLSRCQPDLSAASIRRHAVGSYATSFSSEWVLVDAGICTQTDKDKLNDGFKSFPSGHASFSWAGLLYLSLFLCAKFAITFPIGRSRRAGPQAAAHQYDAVGNGIYSSNGAAAYTKREDTMSDGWDEPLLLRNEGAAAPTWTYVLALVPIGVAIYVCSTRYVQYRHFGADLIGGTLVGALSAYVAFRWYHQPIGSGAGYAWGARSRGRAFGVGVGTSGYVGPEGWGSRAGEARHDLENGQ